MGCPILEILLTKTRSSEVQGQDKKSREENKKGLHKEETSHRSIVGLSKFRSEFVLTAFNRGLHSIEYMVISYTPD